MVKILLEEDLHSKTRKNNRSKMEQYPVCLLLKLNKLSFNSLCFKTEEEFNFMVWHFRRNNSKHSKINNPKQNKMSNEILIASKCFHH